MKELKQKSDIKTPPPGADRSARPEPDPASPSVESAGQGQALERPGDDTGKSGNASSGRTLFVPQGDLSRISGEGDEPGGTDKPPASPARQAHRFTRPARFDTATVFAPEGDLDALSLRMEETAETDETDSPAIQNSSEADHPPRPEPKPRRETARPDPPADEDDIQMEKVDIDAETYAEELSGGAEPPFTFARNADPDPDPTDMPLAPDTEPDPVSNGFTDSRQSDTEPEADAEAPRFADTMVEEEEEEEILRLSPVHILRKGEPHTPGPMPGEADTPYPDDLPDPNQTLFDPDSPLHAAAAPPPRAPADPPRQTDGTPEPSDTLISSVEEALADLEQGEDSEIFDLSDQMVVTASPETGEQPPPDADNRGTDHTIVASAADPDYIPDQREEGVPPHSGEAAAAPDAPTLFMESEPTEPPIDLDLSDMVQHATDPAPAEASPFSEQPEEETRSDIFDLSTDLMLAPEPPDAPKSDPRTQPKEGTPQAAEQETAPESAAAAPRSPEPEEALQPDDMAPPKAESEAEVVDLDDRTVVAPIGADLTTEIDLPPESPPEPDDLDALDLLAGMGDMPSESDVLQNAIGLFDVLDGDTDISGLMQHAAAGDAAASDAETPPADPDPTPEQESADGDEDGADETPLPKQRVDPSHPTASSEQIEAAMERAIEKIFSRRIEGIIHQVVEQAVSAEMKRFRSILGIPEDPDGIPRE